MVASKLQVRVSISCTCTIWHSWRPSRGLGLVHGVNWLRCMLETSKSCRKNYIISRNCFRTVSPSCCRSHSLSLHLDLLIPFGLSLSSNISSIPLVLSAVLSAWQQYFMASFQTSLSVINQAARPSESTSLLISSYKLVYSYWAQPFVIAQWLPGHELMEILLASFPSIKGPATTHLL